MKGRQEEIEPPPPPPPFNLREYETRIKRGAKINLLLILATLTLMWCVMLYARDAKREREMVESQRLVALNGVPKGVPKAARVLLFDGDCVLCDSTVAFFLRFDDPHSDLMFAPLQSAAGRALLAHMRLPLDIQSVVLVEHGVAFTKSTAILRVLKRMPLPWRLLYLPGIFVLDPIRDALYDVVASNRFALFGRLGVASHDVDECPAATASSQLLGDRLIS